MSDRGSPRVSCVHSPRAPWRSRSSRRDSWARRPPPDSRPSYLARGYCSSGTRPPARARKSTTLDEALRSCQTARFSPAWTPARNAAGNRYVAGEVRGSRFEVRGRVPGKNPSPSRVTSSSRGRDGIIRSRLNGEKGGSHACKAFRCRLVIAVGQAPARSTAPTPRELSVHSIDGAGQSSERRTGRGGSV